MSDLTEILMRLDGLEHRLDGIGELPPHNNFAASASPVASDDDTEGYQVGSLWVDTAVEGYAAYICVDASSSAADWSRIDNV